MIHWSQTAAVVSVILILLVLLTWSLDLESGNQWTRYFAPHRAVALKVSLKDFAVLDLLELSERLNKDWLVFVPGVITSPNYPGPYPKNLDKTEQIEVTSGNIMRLEFTIFKVHTGDTNINTCPDFVRITDGDGTILMDNSCGYSDSTYLGFQPPIIRTKTNKVEIYFHSDNVREGLGWSLNWTAVSEGGCYGNICTSKLTKQKESERKRSIIASLKL